MGYNYRQNRQVTKILGKQELEQQQNTGMGTCKSITSTFCFISKVNRTM